jgi:23S rRNA (uridine2552-2'-O)-methyltransferase
VGKAWVKARRRDPFYRRAKAQGYRSRAAFKLLQMDERFGLLRPGDLVADLGAAPGGWSQVAQGIVGRQGLVVAVDLRGMPPVEGVVNVRGDIHEEATVQEALMALGRPANVILSDMSPRLSGAHATDHARSVDLARAALSFASKALAPGGSLVAKIFQGDLLPGLLSDLSERFDFVKVHSPRASPKGSAQVFVIAKGFRGRR